MESHARTTRTSKGPFQDLCRDLRMSRGLKLREVASAIGIAVSTYGNVEASRHRVISDGRVEKLADFFKLDGAERVRFVTAAAALPLSEYTVDQREKWAKRNELRSKSHRFVLMFEALDNLVCMHAASGDQCTCTPETPADFDAPAR